MPWLLVDVEKSFEDINFKENNNRVGRADSKTSLDTIKQRGPMDSQRSSCWGADGGEAEHAIALVTNEPAGNMATNLCLNSLKKRRVVAGAAWVRA